ncbi:MAG: hypothetical protein R3190_18505, partial [Thermoanaerobaculia bacterium]|nr:hypothetical protein [Thermoanaerobaculia bacterium]
MRAPGCRVALAIGLLAAGAAGAAAATEAEEHATTIQRYCRSCHSERVATAGLVLEGLDPGDVGGDAEVWEKVVHKLRTRGMPPPGRRRPDEATYESLASWLENALDRAAAAHPDPGRPLLHRLNRTEYRNAVRD